VVRAMRVAGRGDPSVGEGMPMRCGRSRDGITLAGPEHLRNLLCTSVFRAPVIFNYVRFGYGICPNAPTLQPILALCEVTCVVSQGDSLGRGCGFPRRGASSSFGAAERPPSRAAASIMRARTAIQNEETGPSQRSQQHCPNEES
jgi:hypothetical protein